MSDNNQWGQQPSDPTTPDPHTPDPYARPAENQFSPANDPYAQPAPTSNAQPIPGQPVPGQPVPGQPVPGQPVPGQSAFGQPATGSAGQAWNPGAPTGGQNPDPAQAGWQTGGFTPAPVKKKSMGKQVIGVVVAIAVIVGVRFGLPKWEGYQASKGLEVGACITLETTSGELDHTAADCGDTTVISYTVVEKLDSGVCQDPYSTYTTEYDDKVVSTTCLMENLPEGKCFAQDSDNMLNDVPCSDPTAEFQVTKRIDGSADVAQCPDGDGFAYPKAPQRVYCLGAPA